MMVACGLAPSARSARAVKERLPCRRDDDVAVNHRVEPAGQAAAVAIVRRRGGDEDETAIVLIG